MISVKEGLRKTVEYFESELADMGEIIPTGPKAEKPQPLIKPILDVSRPRDERRLSLQYTDTVESISESKHSVGYSGISSRFSVSEVLVDVNEDRKE